MTRVKGGTTTRKRHKTILKLAKGYRGQRSKIYRRAKEAVLHAGEYAFAGRKKRKRDFRRLWIQRINAALISFDLKYSRFIKMLQEKNIELDRKILADLALKNPKVFEEVVKKVKI